MSPKEIETTPDNETILALEECERRMISACRRGREATQAVGKELATIRDRELYKVRYEFFQDYVQLDCKLDMTSAYRIMKVYETCDGIETEGLALPENESQAIELSKLQPDRRVPVWRRILAVAEREDTPITVKLIKTAVEKEEERAAATELPKPRPAKGVQVSMEPEDEKESNGEKPVATPPETVSLTERGEAALERIRRICGDEVADAIESMRLPISEREIRQWADQDDQLVYELAHYVANERWSVAKAINYASRMIDGATTVDTLITICRSRGGRLTFVHDDARATVEILAKST